MSAKAKKVVLAYSGGLDTSVIIPWLKENYGAEVIAFAADIGQGAELDGLEEKAIRTGASKCIIEDLREEFACEFVLPCLRAGAVYERKYLLGTSFARPLIARRQVEIAEAEGADAVSHGCTGKGNDQVRFELAFKALNPRLKIIAPWREWDLKSREDEIDYALARKIPITATKEKIYSEDRNLWHISHEGGILEDPWVEPEESMFVLSVTSRFRCLQLLTDGICPYRLIQQLSLQRMDLANQVADSHACSVDLRGIRQVRRQGGDLRL